MPNVLPITSNTTCDIYHSPNQPPAAPAVSGVKIYLTPDYARDHDKALAASTYYRWTHVALVPLNTDVRDDYSATMTTLGNPSAQDSVYFPTKNDTKYWVVFVERINRGTTQDCLRVYLQRQKPTWPTQNL